jgi:hypothetical protein
MLEAAFTAAVEESDGGEKVLLPYFHSPVSRESSSSEHLNSMASCLQPDPRIPMVRRASLTLILSEVLIL